MIAGLAYADDRAWRRLIDEAKVVSAAGGKGGVASLVILADLAWDTPAPARAFPAFQAFRDLLVRAGCYGQLAPPARLQQPQGLYEAALRVEAALGAPPTPPEPYQRPEREPRKDVFG